MSPVEAELRATAEFLRPDLRDEISRLYARIDVLEAHCYDLADKLLKSDQAHYVATVTAGTLREQNATLKNRLEHLAPEQHAIARRDALFTGTGFLRIRRHSRDRYDVERIDPARVVIHHDD